MSRFNITTECYIRRGDEILFIHKGRNDMNTGKYLGIGGHLEEGESPNECIVREIEEETGMKYLPSDFKKKGGYQRSILLSKEYNLYRQNFCGCEFSR